VQEKKSLTGRMVLTFVAIGIGVAILVGVLFGWNYSIIGLGAAIGPWIGIYFGNKKAREVDKYREELINGRKPKPKQDVPDTTKPPA
jgi:uncharacterized membrane protein YgaE (UPF0421/DUF939 family)